MRQGADRCVLHHEFIAVVTDVEHLQWAQTLFDANKAIEAELYWECKANGKPQPVYRWLKNGQPLFFEVIMLKSVIYSSIPKLQLCSN